MKLFYFILGCTPAGRHTEQHDVFFCIAKDLTACVPLITDFWPDAGKIHIDAWREVTVVNGYRIAVSQRTEEKKVPPYLFFINLGGYRQYDFEEYHHKLLAIAPDMGAAIQLAKQTAFYRDFHAGALAASHVDNKYGVDVDDIVEVKDILPLVQKEQYIIQLIPGMKLPEDELHIGYLKLDKLSIP